jgi:hypothetical protein
MEILRVPPYNTQVAIDVSAPAGIYEYTVEDMADHSVISGTATSTPGSKVIIELPSEYDNTYLITIADEEYYVDIVRPYVDPNTKGTTASEIAEYAKNEELARAIIDSVIKEGFYYKKHVLETVGLGADYIPLWTDAKKILAVYENNVLVTDREYEITADKTAITQSYSGQLNREEQAGLVLPLSVPDTGDGYYYLRGAFPKTYDYKFILASGYPKLPADIVRAAELLIDDISCGKLDYYKRYISEYNTDQFRIKFDGMVFEGTGNILVDKILSKYVKSITRLGVL